MIRFKYIFISTVLIFCFNSCQVDKKETSFNLNEYVNKIKQDLALSVVEDSTIQLIMANNPYNFDKDVLLSVYFNHTIIYHGQYCQSIDLKVPKIRQNNLAHFSIEVVKDNELIRFSDKSVFDWDINYKCVYLAFFPTNQDTDQAHFFPQMEYVIQ
jgi:hypothetical protein